MSCGTQARLTHIIYKFWPIKFGRNSLPNLWIFGCHFLNFGCHRIQPLLGKILVFLELVSVLLRPNGVAEFVRLAKVRAQEALVPLRLALQIHVLVHVWATIEDPWMLLLEEDMVGAIGLHALLRGRERELLALVVAPLLIDVRVREGILGSAEGDVRRAVEQPEERTLRQQPVVHLVEPAATIAYDFLVQVPTKGSVLL